MYRLIFATSVGLVAFPGISFATTLSGDIVGIEKPASVLPGAQEHELAQIFIEAVDVVLTRDVAVDILPVAGTYTFGSVLPGGMIDAGTTINSYFIHQDTIGANPADRVSSTFSVTFDEPILGVILLGDFEFAFGTALDDSDFLGEPGTAYIKNSAGLTRGTLEGAGDVITLSSDGFTLSGVITTQADLLDQIRIITFPIPTPGSFALLTMAGLSFTHRKRK